MRRVLALLAVGALVVSGCGDDGAVGIGASTTLPSIPGTGANEQDRLEAAAARWAAAGIEDYEWTYARSCFCPQLTVTVQVEGGEAVDHQLDADDGGFPATEEEIQILTIPDLFEMVQGVIRTADSFTVEYEPETGRVVSLDVDPIGNAIDDEFGYEVRSFEAIGDTDPTDSPPLDEETLSESWACGRGFHVSDPDQTVALMLDLADPTWEVVPSQAATLPSDAWDARVVVGADLFSNWCDDLIDTDDPRPRTDQTWPIVEGTVTFAEDVATLSNTCTAPVVAHLSGLVADRPDGTRVAIADRDVSNSCWGGAAG